jgi:hypothetical protein
MGTPASTASTLSQLRQWLDETGAALARADLAQLVTCEAQLQTALAALAGTWPISGDRVQLAAELEQLRTSVSRCQRLGASMNDFLRISLDGIGGEPATHTFRHSA